MNHQTDPIARLGLLLLAILFMAYLFSTNPNPWNAPAAASVEVPGYPTDAAPICEEDAAPQPVSQSLGTNVALEKTVISRAGGINYADWGSANDAADYDTTTQAENGRWGMNTNGGEGSYEVVDLGREYALSGVGYSLDWDGAFKNPLTFQVLVSTDNESWTLVSNVVHRYTGQAGGHQVNVDLAITPVRARYVKYWEPPDGDWNGWGDFFQLRAYAEE